MSDRMQLVWAWCCYQFVMLFPFKSVPPFRWWQPGRIYWAALPWAGTWAYRHEARDE
jgi:hypothetical protein